MAALEDAELIPARLTDAAGRTTGYGYDAMSRQTQVFNTAIQAAPLSQRGFTPDGLLASLTDANGNTTSYAYDGFDRLQTTTYPAPSGGSATTENYTYDNDSNVRTRKTRRGDTITLTYDTLNRLKTKAAPSEATVTYAYDLTGRVTSVSDNSSALPAVPGGSASYVVNYSYDAMNRLPAPLGRMHRRKRLPPRQRSPSPTATIRRTAARSRPRPTIRGCSILPQRRAPCPTPRMPSTSTRRSARSRQPTTPTAT